MNNMSTARIAYNHSASAAPSPLPKRERWADIEDSEDEFTIAAEESTHPSTSSGSEASSTMECQLPIWSRSSPTPEGEPWADMIDDDDLAKKLLSSSLTSRWTEMEDNSEEEEQESFLSESHTTAAAQEGTCCTTPVGTAASSCPSSSSTLSARVKLSLTSLVPIDTSAAKTFSNSSQGKSARQTVQDDKRSCEAVEAPNSPSDTRVTDQQLETRLRLIFTIKETDKYRNVVNRLPEGTGTCTPRGDCLHGIRRIFEREKQTWYRSLLIFNELVGAIEVDEQECHGPTRHSDEAKQDDKSRKGKAQARLKAKDLAIREVLAQQRAYSLFDLAQQDK